ncbi:hypothetical protein SAMN06265361_101247 [Laceyella tengchongensis]|uniref:Uncharacterized protein n=1 Tax=Laceyella tengchongensis TaxID=574699 RepID=A0AA45WIX3_9BACL|nr:hypothetical protein [Laceyella tengchongensis]SMP01440.1 hypothetical protein SAMN06265361_101247 [Laceyella tengchongensis]
MQRIMLVGIILLVTIGAGLYLYSYSSPDAGRQTMVEEPKPTMKPKPQMSESIIGIPSPSIVWKISAHCN